MANEARALARSPSPPGQPDSPSPPQGTGAGRYQPTAAGGRPGRFRVLPGHNPARGLAGCPGRRFSRVRLSRRRRRAKTLGGDLYFPAPRKEQLHIVLDSPPQSPTPPRTGGFHLPRPFPGSGQAAAGGQPLAFGPELRTGKHPVFSPGRQYGPGGKHLHRRKSNPENKPRLGQRLGQPGGQNHYPGISVCRRNGAQAQPPHPAER